MASIVQRVSDVGARLLLKPATVSAVTDHGDGLLRTVEIAGDRLVGAQWVPGDKLRVRADALALRTYTPIAWDEERGRTRLLVAAHGSGPGSGWCRGVQPGDECQLLGPDRSVRLDRLAAECLRPDGVDPGPIFVGDETSFGLVLAWAGSRGSAAPAVSLFEVADSDASAALLRDLGVAPTALVARTADNAQRNTLAGLALDAVRTRPDAPLCLTGCAQTIAVVRRLLKTEGVAAPTTVVKAYWDENRRGLD